MPKSYKDILIKNKGGLRVIVLNNPKKKNALDRQAYRDIAEALNDAAADDDVRVVAITGTGDFYSSGNDLAQSLKADESLTDILKSAENVLYAMIKAFYTFPKLLIAVINGPCIGIAATTAVLCDVVYAEENAYFYTPFTQLGLCAEGCSSYTFPRILGRSKSNEMLMLNYKLSAPEALRYGFVSEIFRTDELESKIWTRVEEFTKLPIGSIKVSKELISKFELENLEKANKNETQALSERWLSDEPMNAVMEFMNRRNKSKL